MHFAQILSECIEALAQGQSVEAVLTLHPEHAEELAPLLHVVTSLQPQSSPKLSEHAFQRGRAALADAARRRSALSSPGLPPTPAEEPTHHRRFIPYRDLLEQKQKSAHAAQPLSTSPLANGHPNTAMLRRVSAAGDHRSHGRSRLLAGRHPHAHPHAATATTAKRSSGKRSSGKRSSSLHRLRQFMTVALPIVLILTSAILLRQAAISTPGSPLYGLKTVSEQGQGLLMTAAGEGATWHANQTLRRLGELAQMTTVPESVDAPLSNDTAVATLATSVAERATMHADQALAAGALLSTTEERTFLRHWLTGLDKLEQTLQQAPDPSAAALALLQKTKKDVVAATIALDPSPIERTEPTASSAPDAPLVEPTVTTELPTALPVATVPATATTAPHLIATPVDPLPTATRVLKATAVPTPTRVPARIQSDLSSPTIAPTATPLPIMTQVIPLERQSGNRSDEESSTNDSTSTGGTTEPSTDSTSTNNSGTDNSGKESADNNGDEQHDESTPPDDRNDSASPVSTGSADDVTATIVPTAPLRTPTPSTGEETVPTASTSLPKTTGVSTVEPDVTISAPELPTVLGTTVAPGQAGSATATPAAQSTALVLDEVPVPILVTVAPIASSVPTVPVPPTAEGQGTTEALPTRTRRPTATPTFVTDPPVTRTTVPAPTDSPPPTHVPAVTVTTVAEPTNALAP